MPFKLSRSGNNVPAEVQRWQYFLRKLGIPQVGSIDADFGPKTEEGTKIFQIQQQLTAHGRVDSNTLNVADALGYRILPNDYYTQRSSASWPPRPNNLNSPTNSWRNTEFQCFKFRQRPLNQRPDRESIVIGGSCDGSVNDWASANIVDLHTNKFEFAAGFGGRIRCHRKAKEKLEELLNIWENESLLHLVISYAGCYVPRYKRNQAPPGSGGHSTRRSDQTNSLSNHSFGSAFDINASQNWLGDTPAICGRKGAVRELVESANSLDIFWGGHFNGSKDGMHFELSHS